MRIIIIFILIFSSVLICAADDISFTGGCKIKNISILTNTKNILTIKTTDNKIISFENPNILEITKLKVDIYKNSTLGGYNCLRIDPIYQIWEDQYQETFVDKSYYTYPNLFLLPVSFIAFALTYDAIGDWEKLNDIINVSDSIDNLKSQRTKYYILGAMYFIAGVVNTKFAFEKVRISPGKNGVQLTYNF